MRRVFSALLLTLLLGHAAALADVDVSLAHAGRVYDAATDRLFCLTGGSITPVNPATGALEAPIVVTTTSNLLPHLMTLSQTGSQLYVGHDFGRRLAQVDLGTRLVVADWSAGTDSFGGKYFSSMAVLPGEPDKLLTWILPSTGLGARSYAVFTHGVQTASGSPTSFGTLFVPGNGPGEVLALSNTSPSTMQRLRVVGRGARAV